MPYAQRPMLISWQGDDHNGQAVPAGVYFVQLRAGDYSLVEKAILLK